MTPEFIGVLGLYLDKLNISDMFSTSKYFTSLSDEDKEGYISKLTLSDGQILPDPYSLVENWKNDVRSMPDISWGDVYNYLINTPSLFSKEALKAYKSLEAYNFYTNGHVQDVHYHEINRGNSFCYIKSEVRGFILLRTSEFSTPMKTTFV